MGPEATEQKHAPETEGETRSEETGDGGKNFQPAMVWAIPD